MHITEKGQVTIPIYIRQKFGFLPHTEIDFIIKEDKVVLQKATSSSKSAFHPFLGCATASLTTDEIIHLTRTDSNDSC